MGKEDRPTEREIRIARVLRPLGTKPMTRTQAVMAGKLLGMHWTSVYRLRRRFLGDPVATSVAPMLRGPKPGNKRVVAPVEQVIADVLARWLPKQRELAHPQLDTWMEIRRRCMHAALPAPGRNTVARRLAEHRDTQAALLADEPGAQIPPGNLVATAPLEIVQIDHTQSDVEVVDDWFRRAIGRRLRPRNADPHRHHHCRAVSLCVRHWQVDESSRTVAQNVDLPLAVGPGYRRVLDLLLPRPEDR